MSTTRNTEFVTRHEFDAGMARIDARFDLFEARLEAKIESAMASTIRWVVGMAFGQYALIFGLVLFLISREAAR